jgi:ABC-type antimicrobial peptide transport system permease subunit
MHYRIDNGTIISKDGSSGFDISIKDLEPGEHYLMVYWSKVYNETEIVKSHEVSLTFKVYSIEDMQLAGRVENNTFQFGLSATSPEFATLKSNSYKYYYETPDDFIYSGYNDDIDWSNGGSITAAVSTSAGTYDVTVWPTNISAVGDTIYELDVGLPISGTLEAIVQ